MMRARYMERGDTLIEVLLSIVILSIVITGAFAVMNRGTMTAYASLERSQARAAIEGQMDILRYLRDEFMSTPAANKAGTTWMTDIINRPHDRGQADSCIPGSGSYYIQPVRTAGAITSYSMNDTITTRPIDGASIAGQVPVPGNGLWVESQRSGMTLPAPEVAYVDFNIKACWFSATGSADDIERVSSTLRLFYD